MKINPFINIQVSSFKLPIYLLFLILVVLSDNNFSNTCAAASALSILKAPVALQAQINGTARLTCQVQYQPQQTFAWLRNRFGFGPATVHDIGEGRYSFPGPTEQGVYDLQITNLQLEDDAQYSCQTSLPNKQPITTEDVNLTVLVPAETPILSQLFTDVPEQQMERQLYNQPAEVTEKSGRLKVRCEALNGRPAASLKWFVDGRLIKRNSNTLGSLKIIQYLQDREIASNKHPKLSSTQSILEIGGLTRSFHNVEVTCESTNKGFEQFPQRVSTHLELFFGPDIHIKAEPLRPNHQYNEGDIVHFTCEVTGRPNLFTYSWSKSKSKESETHYDNALESTFQLKMTRQLNLFYISCSAVSRDYAMATFGPLQIHYQPIISVEKKLYSASVGDAEIKMQCFADANPPAVFEWRRIGGSQILSNSNTLMLKDIKAEDVGKYECGARNENFPPVSEIVWMALKSKPNITSARVQYARVGLSAQLVCDILSVPVPQSNQLSWTRKDLVINTDDDKSNFQRYTQSVIGGVKFVLHIREVKNSDFGEYNCSVENGYGMDRQTIMLASKDEVPIAFVIGVSIAIVMISIFLTIVLCVCRRGDCQRKYFKASMVDSSGESLPVNMRSVIKVDSAKSDTLDCEVDDPWVNCVENERDLDKTCSHCCNNLVSTPYQTNSLSRQNRVSHNSPKHNLLNMSGYRGFDSLTSADFSCANSLTTSLSSFDGPLFSSNVNTSKCLMPRLSEHDELYQHNL